MAPGNPFQNPNQGPQQPGQPLPGQMGQPVPPPQPGLQPMQPGLQPMQPGLQPMQPGLQPMQPAAPGQPVRPVQPGPKPAGLQPMQPGQAPPRPMQPGKPGGPIPAGPQPVPVNKGGMHVHENAATEDDDDALDKSIRSAPPWLVSLVIHTVIVIVLAFLFLPSSQDGTLQLNAEFSEFEGEQLEDNRFTADISEPESFEVSNEEDLEDVVDPFAEAVASDIPPVAAGSIPLGSSETGSMKSELTGRQKGNRAGLRAKYGGNAQSDAAVQRGLEWLKRVQTSKRCWSLQGAGKFKDGSDVENTIAATAMAMLAFQGNGNTEVEGPFKQQVKDGWEYLLFNQEDSGLFAKSGESTGSHKIYTHAQATIAICEIYAMTNSPTLRKKYKGPAEKALQWLAGAQSDSLGGWKYTPKTGADLSVTGWVLMAYQSARMAGLEVPKQSLLKINTFLAKVEQNGGQRYVYQSGGENPTPSMTAEGLLCREYLGWKRDDPRLEAGLDWLLANHLPVWTSDARDVYYWYYATQAFHHIAGDLGTKEPRWNKWNKTMRDLLVRKQVKSGPAAGSWDPYGGAPDKHGSTGGRLYITCLSIFNLEVYYRHLPIYSSYVPK